MNSLTVATVNTFFDGVDVTNKSTASWALQHMKLRINQRIDRRVQYGNLENHPVATIIKTYKPTILVINEVLPGIRWGSGTLASLATFGYSHVFIGNPNRTHASFATHTVIATKLPASPTQVHLRKTFGANVCAIQLLDTNIVIVGVQASALNPRARSTQIEDIFLFITQKQKQGFDIVCAGDFNSELLHNKPHTLTDYTHPSFPQPHLMRAINNLPQIAQLPFKKVMHLEYGPRNLDHIFLPKHWNVTSFETSLTTSDHLALIADAKW